MKRARILVVTLVVGVSFYGGAIPSHAGPRFPRTLDESLELARGLRIAPTDTTGVFVERSARSLPIRGNLIALSLRTVAGGAARVEDRVGIEARFHTADGWSEWETLGVETDEGPDTSSAEYARATRRVYTQPIWVGTADKMAFRMTAHAGGPAMWDVRAHVINTMGNAHAPNIVERVVSAVSRFLNGKQAEAMPLTPRIISRAQWGANESWRDSGPRYAPEVKMAFVHHTAGTNSYSKSQSPALIRGIYKYHTSNLGYSDIAYNFLIDRYGQIFEGRYGGITRPVIGAHAGGFNTGSTGISLMGTFTSATPPSAMIKSLKYLLAWKLDVHHVPPTGTLVMTSGGSTRYPEGRRVTLNRISGHRDTSQTSCPGAKVYYMLDSIRAAVKKMGNPKIYLPTTSAAFVRPNGDTLNETVTLSASLSQAVYRWQVDLRTPDGTLLRSLTGSGTSIKAVWNGRTATGDLPDTGRVLWTMSASTSGIAARPATGVVDVVGTHPDGTVLVSPTRAVVLEDGKARLLPTPLVRNSWFRAKEPVGETEAGIDRYPAGTPMTIREGTLLAEPDGTYSIISGGDRRPFADGVYAALGYTAASALPITAPELATLHSGKEWNDVTRHPEGAVVRAADGSEWTIGALVRHRNPTELVWKSWYRDAEVVAALPGDVALAIGTVNSYRQGTLFRLSDGSLWIYAAGKKRRFYDQVLYSAMGYSNMAPLATLTTSEAGTIPNGPQIG
jgi:N-acetylmuramoyl-L-alanine amidase-like protein